MEEGELRPPTQSGPTKRVEIVSKCKWATEGSRNVVLRTVCEHMAQDRLKQPFWIGKYQVQPTSKTIKKTDEGCLVTYKVVILQPHLEDSEEKKKKARIKQLEAQLIETIGKSEVKGLPLLSQVTPAGLLKAEKKPSGALGQIMVNGKLYPQAKLELGQMGALHPANRLAAYITGRVSVANKHDTKDVGAANKISPVAPTIPTSVATTTVTSTLSSIFTLDKPTAVAKHPLGTEFIHVDSGCVNSEQQKTAKIGTLPMQSTIKNLLFPSSSVLTGSSGISVSPDMPPKASVVYAPPASGTTAGSIQVVRAVSKSGSATPEDTYMLSTPGSNVALPGKGIRLMQPLTPIRPAVPGQRMMMLKAANPAGQLFHLVPLNHFRTLNPNVLIHQQSPLIHLPTPNPVPLSKLQTMTTVASSTAPSSATQDQNMVPVLNTTTDIVMTSSTSPIATKPIIPLSGSQTLLFCNKPSTVKIISGFLNDTATSTLRSLSQRVLEESKIVKEPRMTTSVSLAQSSLEGHSANQGLQLTSQSCLTSKNQTHHNLDNPVHTNHPPAKESCEEDSQCSKMSHENVIFADHSYTIEMKKMSTPSPKPVDVCKDGSTDHILLKEVLDLGLVEEAEGCGTSGGVLGTESGDESKAGSHLMEEEVDSDCTELTEDSDMYDHADSSQSSDKEDLDLVTDSEGEEMNKEQQYFVADVQDLTEKDDDELVDIETFEEGAEKSPAPPESFQNQSSDENDDKLCKLRKRKDEKKRRLNLRNCFYSLQQILNIVDPKVAKIALLSKALKEIQLLTKRRDRLVKMRDKLRKKRAQYIEMASQLSGKTTTSISQKLDEIIAKQKSLEIKNKGNNTSLNRKKRVPKNLQPNVKTKQKKMGTSGKERVSKQKRLGLQDRRTENVDTNQKTTAVKASQPAKPPNSQPPPIPVTHERTKPTVLSHNKCQTLAERQVLVPQVIPVAEAVVPCNQIITISNPLQPIGISLGERQSTTPGVAAVSVSIPPVSDPLPVLQPQVLTLATNSVNKPVDIISLPKISSVVSLVQSEKLLVTPPAAPVMETEATCNSSAGEAQQNPSSDEAILMEEEKHLDRQLPELVPETSEHDAKVSIEDPKKQKEDEKNAPQLEQDDDRLMSLLDELVFLNQTSEPQEAAASLIETGDVLTELLTNRQTDMDQDDERSLSPLFLKLDEDLMTSPASKDEEMDDIPPKVDDLVKVIFGLESPPNSSESEIVAAASDDCTPFSVCHVKHDAPTPPPLLQMKTGGCTTADSPKEQASLSWRPMPKLAPLGLKTQETGHPKLISPHAPKSDSKLPSLHNVHV